MKRSIPLLAGLFVVMATALVQGVWTQRWQKSADMEAAIRRLSNAPGDLGSWKAEPVELDADALTAAGAQGSWVRRYTDARSGASVLVILLCGTFREDERASAGTLLSRGRIRDDGRAGAL